MKRLGLVLAGLALVGAVNTADAQLTMQMTNGWSATFSGNVNAFWIYNSTSSLTTPGNYETSGKLNGIGTGLLPAFFTFEAKGKEGNTDLGVHFGFAPQVSAGRNVASSFGTDAAGAQIDMRQVYLTVGGTWGQILAGKELGLFERQAILTDMTLFGAGVATGFRGTSLGRIGYGYLYTDFRGQFTYSSPAGKVAQISFGVFEPTTTGAGGFGTPTTPFTYGDLPRFETEITFKPKMKNTKNTVLVWVDGMYGHVKCAAVDADCESSTTSDVNPGISTTGLALGGKFDVSGFSFMASGFLASGAAATDERVEEAATPFDRRRHGLIMGMGAAALVVESAEAARERGIQPICEVLSAVTANSAFHGTRLDVQHIGQIMENLVSQAEKNSGINRQEIAPHTVFVSHETYTPARGGSASAEINALRRVFGGAADQLVIANTKGYTGHAMGAGVEDVLAIKALETGIVPAVPNFKEIDPELGVPWFTHDYSPNGGGGPSNVSTRSSP